MLVKLNQVLIFKISNYIIKLTIFNINVNYQCEEINSSSINNEDISTLMDSLHLFKDDNLNVSNLFNHSFKNKNVSLQSDNVNCDKYGYLIKYGTTKIKFQSIFENNKTEINDITMNNQNEIDFISNVNFNNCFDDIIDYLTNLLIIPIKYIKFANNAGLY